MHLSFKNPLFHAVFWLGLFLVLQGGHAIAAAPAPLTPEQAAHTLSILQDDSKRAELEQTLNAIAQASQADTPPQAQAPAPDAASEAPVALTRNGLLAQVFGSISDRLSSSGDKLRLMSRTLLQMGALGTWWQQTMSEPSQRAAWLDGLWKVIVILGATLLAEWLLRRALARPRKRLEHNAAARRAAFKPQDNATVPDLASADTPPSRADRYWSLLRRLPFSVSYCVLGLIPLLVFLVVASLLLNLFGGPAAPFYNTTLLITGAYATTRVTLAIVQLMIAPHQPELRLMHLKQGTALLLSRWLGWIFITAIFGAALVDIAQEVGANDDIQTTISKLVGLLVHLLLLMLVWRSRALAAAAIRGESRSNQGLSMLRKTLADIWPFAATFFIVALWLLWSAGVDNGFQRLLHYFSWSAVVMIAAILLAIFIQGAIDRSFIKYRQNIAGSSEPTSGQSVYQSMVRHTVSIAIGACAFIALLQVWGIDVQSWLAPGSVGRQLASALGTIAVTFILAFSAWEALNLTIERRLERWTSSGDTARATRLRTLVPILRTTLFIAIAMIVLLTVLNQLGVNVAPLIAGAGIIGVALGFGSQKLVQDFITGIFLLMENAMQVGDSVTLAGLSGTVEYLSIRTVRLRAGDGAVHVIPFSSVTTVTNTNRGIGNVSISLSVSADTDIEKVYAAIKDVSADMRADPTLKNLIRADADILGVDQVNGATITIAGKIVTIDSARASVQRAFNARILARFRELGIQFANPQQTWMVTEAAKGNPDSSAAPTPDPVP